MGELKLAHVETPGRLVADEEKSKDKEEGMSNEKEEEKSDKNEEEQFDFWSLTEDG